MTWAILAVVGVQLCVCAAGIALVFLGNRSLRRRPGNIPVRILPQGQTRWRRGHGVWASDVFAWRRSPAAWHEELLPVVEVRPYLAHAEERRRLRRIGDAAVFVELITRTGSLRAATSWANARALLGPFIASEQAVGTT
jgi:hypothetical protein